MPTTTTPITIIESHFDHRLDRSTLKRFDEVRDDQWIGFAKHYLVTMERNFAEEFLQPRPADDSSLRLYFEPRLTHEWDAAIASRYRPTPLLGLNPRPPSQETISRDEVSKMLDPLKKHLLLAQSVYFRDSFYYCFDAVADSVNRNQWRDDPNIVNLVGDSIRSIKNWLPILIELRDFIESGALVFMPYYLTPSFPYDIGAPALRESYQKLRMRPDPSLPNKIRAPALSESSKKFRLQPNPSLLIPNYAFSESEVITAWLNGRILDLDPVFPNAAMSDWAGRLYFDEGVGALNVTSDLIFLDVLPYGGTEGIRLDDLWKIRKNDDVFDAVRRIVAESKQYLEKNAGPETTTRGVSDMCRSFLQDGLDHFERSSSLRFLKAADENKAVGIGLSLAIGVALLPLHPPLALAIGATVLAPFLTPDTARAIQNRFSPTRKAYGYLQTLL